MKFELSPVFMQAKVNLIVVSPVLASWVSKSTWSTLHCKWDCQ